MATNKRKKNHYVNNENFLQAVMKHKENCEKARQKGKQLPKIPDYIGECLLSIADRLSTKPNFSGYSFKEDMKMDGIENCIKYIEKFNEEKSSNPFAYFTQIIYYAFLQRIAKEKKQLYTKLKNSQAVLMLDQSYTPGGEELSLDLNLNADYIDTFIEDYELKMQKDKDKAKQKTQDKLDDDNNEEDSDEL